MFLIGVYRAYTDAGLATIEKSVTKLGGYDTDEKVLICPRLPRDQHLSPEMTHVVIDDSHQLRYCKAWAALASS